MGKYETNIEAYLVKISGVVTGVGFRYSAKAFVSQFPEVKGYVRNVCEGQVEALIQGKKEHLEAILAWFAHGPSHARVDSIKIDTVPTSKELRCFMAK